MDWRECSIINDFGDEGSNWEALPNSVRHQREAEIPKNKTDVSAYASDLMTEDESRQPST